MSKVAKRIMALFLALALAAGCLPVDQILAASAYQSTESIDSDVEETEYAEVYFVNQSTNCIITVDGVANNPIDCNTEYTGEDSVPENGLFTISYGTYEGNEVVNFSNEANDSNWKADNDSIYQISNHPTASGWESITIEQLGNNYIAFKSSASGEYVTVSDGELVLTSYTDLSDLPAEARFILFTDTTPKTAKKVTTSSESGNSVVVSWDAVSETLFSGYEVLYSTSENGTYTSAGETADTTFTVTGLTLSTRYYFKVRTKTNESGPYADSAIVYTDTKADLKPSTPTDVEVELADDGESQVITWTASTSVLYYNIYRAESRYGDYELIEKGVTDTTYTDTDPNSDSKYSNYYKIMAVNNSDYSDLSEPGSLEISMFGINTYVFNETDDMSQIQEDTYDIYTSQHYNQFGDERYCFMFKDGDYNDVGVIDMGYYTQLIGLGELPTDVQLYNVETPAALDYDDNNSTCNFWVSIENVEIDTDADDNAKDEANAFRWAASQAAPARRLYVERNAFLQWYSTDSGSWASGGYIADSYFETTAGSYTQQQYYTRNTYYGEGFWGVNWNTLLQGCEGDIYSQEDNTGHTLSGTDVTSLLLDDITSISGSGISNWYLRGCTTSIDTTEEIREKPFLYFDDEEDTYKVFIPGLREDSTGTTWTSSKMGSGYEDSMGEGTSITVNSTNFYIAKEGDTAADINYWLARGRNIIFTAGVYELEEPLVIPEEDTILLGLGLATLEVNNSEGAIITEDVGGISIAGLLIDAGEDSEYLVQIGDEGCNKDHSDNPTVLQDVFFRVGGTGKTLTTNADACLVVNSNDTIIDHTWIWRADHGDNTGWYSNTSENGLVVNGDNVVGYALFVEHFQKYDILWRGEYGRTYFVQNEKCYDPQDQASWMSHGGTKNGYSAYKVANNVEHHYATCIGVYDVFIYTNGASIYLDSAVEVPDTDDVIIENVCTVEIADEDGPQVGINSIVNGTGPAITTGTDSSTGTGSGYAVQRLLYYVNHLSTYLTDYYEDSTGTTQYTATGITPSDDEDAEKDIEKEEYSKDEDVVPLPETDDDYFAAKVARMEAALLSSGSDDTTEETSTEEETSSSSSSSASNVSKNIRPDKVTIGYEFEDGKYIYRITALNDDTSTYTVSLIGVVESYKSTLKKVVVPATATYKDTESSYSCTFKVTAVGKKAFAKMKTITSAKVGNNVVKIKNGAFRGCTKLKKVTIGKNVKRVMTKAFLNCKKLRRVTIKKSIKVIGKKAFFKCKKLKKVTIGKSITRIKAKAFASSKKLKKLTVKGKKLKVVASSAFNAKVKATLKVKAKKKNLKKLNKALGRA